MTWMTCTQVLFMAEDILPILVAAAEPGKE